MHLSCPATTSFPAICGTNYLTFVFFLLRIKNKVDKVVIYHCVQIKNLNCDAESWLTLQKQKIVSELSVCVTSFLF